MSDSGNTGVKLADADSVNSRCQRCGAGFHCGMNDQQPCWCASDFPPVISGEAGGSCLCPRCLEQLTRGTHTS